MQPHLPHHVLRAKMIGWRWDGLGPWRAEQGAGWTRAGLGWFVEGLSRGQVLSQICHRTGSPCLAFYCGNPSLFLQVVLS